MTVVGVPMEEVRYEAVLRDDIYSARSPSPPNITDGVHYSRRTETLDPNPRVIPTDRNEYSFASSRGVPGMQTVLNPYAIPSLRNESISTIELENLVSKIDLLFQKTKVTHFTRIPGPFRLTELKLLCLKILVE